MQRVPGRYAYACLSLGLALTRPGPCAQTGTRFARKKLDVFQEAEDGWACFWSATLTVTRGWKR